MSDAIELQLAKDLQRVREAVEKIEECLAGSIDHPEGVLQRVDALEREMTEHVTEYKDRELRQRNMLIAAVTSALAGIGAMLSGWLKSLVGLE